MQHEAGIAFIVLSIVSANVEVLFSSCVVDNISDASTDLE